MLLKMALFPSFFSGCVIFHCVHIYVCVCLCIYHIFFIHSSIDAHLGCFHILVTVNSATMSIRVLRLILIEKAMAPHSSTLAWKIPWTEEPGGLQSMGLLRVGHDWATSLWLFTFMHWRRKWQPTPVFLPRESQGQGSLVGCHRWGCTESDTTEVT